MSKTQQFLSNNPLATRNDLAACCQELLKAVDPFFTAGCSGLALGETTTHYGKKIAEMEAFSRLLWGVFPLLSGDFNSSNVDHYFDAIRVGTDPNHPQYWGEINDFDQRAVEMAVYGYGMALLGEGFWKHFSESEANNVQTWLEQSAWAAIPDNNWHFFPIMVQIGFQLSGKPYDQKSLDFHFAKIEEYYLADGWYCDGIGRPRDYYISMGFHFYSLFYAKLMKSHDPERSALFVERAKLFANDFIWMFAKDGDAIAFGRSLTYRFAEAAFWSAVAFVDEDIYDLGVVKGLLLRHLRFWFKQPIFDHQGLLTIGYHYSNLIMAEDYNAPGSTYWAAKVFLVVALGEEHPFWQAEEKPLPEMSGIHILPHANQIITHSDESKHVWMLTSGQLELNNYVNTESKYTKFAYSNQFGFTLERGRYQLKHNACDSMLLLSEGDGYYRGRRECESVDVTEQYIVSTWRPWKNVAIKTWLIPCSDWHIRLHCIDSERELEAVEGGFSIKKLPQSVIESSQTQCRVVTEELESQVVDLLNGAKDTQCVTTPPNSNILYPEQAYIPVSTHDIYVGRQWIASAIFAGKSSAHIEAPTLSFNGQEIEIVHLNETKTIKI